MGHGGGFAEVLVMGIIRSPPRIAASPRHAHRDGGAPLYVHAVYNVDAAKFVPLTIAAHAALFEHVRELVIGVLGRHFGDGLAEVPEEPVAGFGAFHYMTDQHREPRRH